MDPTVHTDLSAMVSDQLLHRLGAGEVGVGCGIKLVSRGELNRILFP